MKLFLFVISVSCIVFCNKMSFPTKDVLSCSEVSMSKNEGELNFSDTSWQYSDIIFPSIKFNKQDYDNLVNIYFAAELRSDSQSDTCFAELYNIKDSTTIANSRIVSNDTTLKYYESLDILSNLPSKEINISVRVKCSKHSNNVYIRFPKILVCQNQSTLPLNLAKVKSNVGHKS